MGMFITRKVKRGHAVGPQVPARFYNNVDEVLSYLDVFNGHIERHGNRWTIVVDQSAWDTAGSDCAIVADDLSQEFVADTYRRVNQDYGWPTPTYADCLDTGWSFPVRPPGGTAKRYATWAFISDRLRDTMLDTGFWGGDSGVPWPDTGAYWHTGGDTSTCRGQTAKITDSDAASSGSAPLYVSGGGFFGNGLYVRYADGYSPASLAVSMCIDTYAVNAEQGGINVNDSSAYSWGGETGKTHAVNIVLYDTAGDSVMFQIKGGIVI